ncbi:hypothetical protein V1511DRAFT_502896 [Dipodascopsis uninucleata]
MSQPSARPMVAREGREKQRYSASGARLVAGVVPLSRDKQKVLVVSSMQRQDRFIVPKGGYEIDEPTPEDAALREAWEEAGVTGNITVGLGVIEDSRPAKYFESNTDRAIPPRAEYHFFEMIVDRVHDQWPESNKRLRKWITYKEATSGIIDRPELLDALSKSSINKDL